MEALPYRDCPEVQVFAIFFVNTNPPRFPWLNSNKSVSEYKYLLVEYFQELLSEFTPNVISKKNTISYNLDIFVLIGLVELQFSFSQVLMLDVLTFSVVYDPSYVIDLINEFPKFLEASDYKKK